MPFLLLIQCKKLAGQFAVFHFIVNTQQMLLRAPNGPGVHIDSPATLHFTLAGERNPRAAVGNVHPEQVILAGVGELHPKALVAVGGKPVDDGRCADEVAADRLVQQVAGVPMQAVCKPG